MKLHLPLEGIGTTPGIYLTQRFGEHPEIYGQFGMKGHNGNDYGAPLGTPIHAAHDGNVNYYDDPNGYGLNARVFFDEDGFSWETVYGHMQKYEGTARSVKQGDVIGYVNSTGFSTGNHLHFGVRKLLNGSVVDYNNGYFGYLDPTPFFKESMKKFYIDDNGTISLVVIDGFAVGGGTAKTPQAKQELESAFEFTGTEPVFKV